LPAEHTIDGLGEAPACWHAYGWKAELVPSDVQQDFAGAVSKNEQAVILFSVLIAGMHPQLS